MTSTVWEAKGEVVRGDTERGIRGLPHWIPRTSSGGVLACAAPCSSAVCPERERVERGGRN
jgi:hypothetical protein